MRGLQGCPPQSRGSRAWPEGIPGPCSPGMPQGPAPVLGRVASLPPFNFHPFVCWPPPLLKGFCVAFTLFFFLNPFKSLGRMGCGAESVLA